MSFKSDAEIGAAELAYKFLTPLGLTQTAFPGGDKLLADLTALLIEVANIGREKGQREAKALKEIYFDATSSLDHSERRREKLRELLHRMQTGEGLLFAWRHDIKDALAADAADSSDE